MTKTVNLIVATWSTILLACYTETKDNLQQDSSDDHYYNDFDMQQFEAANSLIDPFGKRIKQERSDYGKLILKRYFDALAGQSLGKRSYGQLYDNVGPN